MDTSLGLRSQVYPWALPCLLRPLLMDKFFRVDLLLQSRRIFQLLFIIFYSNQVDLEPSGKLHLIIEVSGSVTEGMSFLQLTYS